MVFILFSFVFKWVQRIKIFKWCSKFLLNDSIIWVVNIFKQKVLSSKVYSKEFSCLNHHSEGSPPHVNTWQPRLGPNRLKPWPVGQGVGSTGQPLGPLGLASGPLGPRVKYTPMMMMILAFGQLHFVIPWNAPICYLSSWNQINTKIVKLG
jgi:hypothetical protein